MYNVENKCLFSIRSNFLYLILCQNCVLWLDFFFKSI